MTDRLPTELWLAAQLRQLMVQSIPAYVIRKGEAQTGVVLVKIIIPPLSCRFYIQSRNLEGVLGWMDLSDGENVDESRADLYIQKAIKNDPDLWVIEVEDKTGKNPFI